MQRFQFLANNSYLFYKEGKGNFAVDLLHSSAAPYDYFYTSTTSIVKTLFSPRFKLLPFPRTLKSVFLPQIGGEKCERKKVLFLLFFSSRLGEEKSRLRA